MLPPTPLISGEVVPRISLSTGIVGYAVIPSQTPGPGAGGLVLDAGRGLAVIDVDEVLALFVQGFDRFLRTRGYELRLNTFALFASIYGLDAETPAELKVAQGLLASFFAEGCGGLDPAPGAAEALADLSTLAQVVILTNAPEPARALRKDWLRRHNMDYPMILGVGLKGPAVADLARQVKGPVMFVDDLVVNLDSVAEAAPDVVRVQMIADPTLRRIAPTAPDRHALLDSWTDLLALGRRVFAL